MKGDLMRKILEAVSYSAKNAGDVFYAISTADFPASIGKMEYLAQHHSYLRSLGERDKKAEKRYCSLLYKLKRDGLILDRNRGKNRIISITKRGTAKLHALLNRASGKQYERQESGTMIIVAFDVPERRKKERNWLRDTLKHLGYRMVQKSVWAGTVKIPEEFLTDLKKRNLIDNVEILSVRGGQTQDALHN
jgi:CRISPR-associated endonuclease Cas2